MGSGQGARYLIVGEDAGGTVPPALALAEALVDAGGAVTYLSQPSVEVRARAAGCDFIAFAGVPDYRVDRVIEEQLDIAVPLLSGKGVGDEVVRVANELACDAVVIEADMAGAAAGAETLACPSVILLNHMFATFVDTWFGDFWPFFQPAINATRSGYGLEPVASWAEVFAPHALVAAAVPPSFDAPVASMPTGIRRTGFLVPQGGGPQSADVNFGQGSGPKVVVGLSSTYQGQEELFQNCVDALGRVDAAGLATTTRAMDPGRFTAPGNVALAGYVSHAGVVPMADVVVTHAGLGTLAVALASGVPVVCAPMSRDQHLNAERAVATGTGVVVSHTASPDEIAEAIREVAGDPSYRTAAEQLAAESHRSGEALGLAAAIAELVQD